MFVCRQFLPGILTERMTPVGLLTLSAGLGTLSLFGLSFATSAVAVFMAARLCGVGKCFFWPTMLGIASGRYPKGGAFALGLRGGCGVISAGFLMFPAMGIIQDHYSAAKIAEIRPAAFHKIRRDGALGFDERKVALLTQPLELQAVAEAKRYSAVMTYRRICFRPDRAVGDAVGIVRVSSGDPRFLSGEGSDARDFPLSSCGRQYK